MTGWSPAGASEWGSRPVARAVADAAPRRRAIVMGSVRTVRACSAPCTFCEAVLDDGTGAITLRWLGRRGVAGLAAGRQMVAEGTVVDQHGLLVLLNPLYRFLGGSPAGS